MLSAQLITTQFADFVVRVDHQGESETFNIRLDDSRSPWHSL
jgi:hypothetical protein